MYRATFPVVVRHFALFRAFGKAREAVRREYPVEDLWQRTVALTAEFGRWDPRTTETRIREVIYGAWEARIAAVPLFPGVPELLAWLGSRSVTRVAMSDFPVHRKLELLGIADTWEHAFSSEEVGYLKPRMEPFQRILDLTGAEPHQVLYVGNSYQYDILGAKALGMRTAHISRRRHSGSVADVTCRGYGELRRWLEQRLPT